MAKPWGTFRIALSILFVTFSVIVVVVVNYMIKLVCLSTSYERIEKQIATSHELVLNLDSSDTILIKESLSLLGQRHDPNGRENARKLIYHTNPHVARLAALYLGAIGDDAGVDGLIAIVADDQSKSREVALSYLRSITHVDFGMDASAWNAWRQTNGKNAD